LPRLKRLTGEVSINKSLLKKKKYFQKLKFVIFGFFEAKIIKIEAKILT